MHYMNMTHQGEARLVRAGLLDGDVEVELLRVALCLANRRARFGRGLEFG